MDGAIERVRSQLMQVPDLTFEAAGAGLEPTGLDPAVRGVLEHHGIDLAAVGCPHHPALTNSEVEAEVRRIIMEAADSDCDLDDDSDPGLAGPTGGRSSGTRYRTRPGP